MPRSISPSAASHSQPAIPPATPAMWRQSIGPRAATGQLILCAAVRARCATTPVRIVFDACSYWAVGNKDFSHPTCHQIAHRWQHTFDNLDTTDTAVLALLFSDAHGDELRLIPQADPTTPPPDTIRRAITEARASLTCCPGSSRRKTRRSALPATMHMTDPHHLHATLGDLIDDGDLPSGLLYLSGTSPTGLTTFYDPDAPSRPQPHLRSKRPRSRQATSSPAASAHIYWASLVLACEVAGDLPLGFITVTGTRTRPKLDITVPNLLLQEHHLSTEILMNAAEHGFDCDIHYELPDRWILS